MTDETFLHAAAQRKCYVIIAQGFLLIFLDLNRVPRSSAFVSLSCSLPFVLKLAITIREQRPNEDVWVSVVDGRWVRRYHSTWRGPDVCRALRKRRLLQDWLYYGCFELLVLNEVSKACVLACVNLNDILNLASLSPAVDSFMQLGLLKTSSNRQYFRDKDTPVTLDSPTGFAAGALIVLFFTLSKIQACDGSSIDCFVCSLLRDFAMPGREKWSVNDDFLTGLKNGLESQALAHLAKARNMRSPRKAPNKALTVRGTSRVAATAPRYSSLVTYGPGTAMPNRVMRMGTLYPATVIDPDLATMRYHHNPLPDASGSQETEEKDGSSEWDIVSLNDIFSNEEEHRAVLHDSVDAGEETNDAPSATIGRQDPLNGTVTAGDSPAFAMRYVQWDALLLPEVVDNSEQKSIRRAMLHAWLYEEDG